MAKNGYASSPDEQQIAQSTYIKPRARLLHDPAVTFEEYQHYAKRTREEQDHLASPKLRWRQIINRSTHNEDALRMDAVTDGKITEVPEFNIGNEENRLQISDEEWSNASRAMRTASCKSSYLLYHFPILTKFGFSRHIWRALTAQTCLGVHMSSSKKKY